MLVSINESECVERFESIIERPTSGVVRFDGDIKLCQAYEILA